MCTCTTSGQGSQASYRSPQHLRRTQILRCRPLEGLSCPLAPLRLHLLCQCSRRCRSPACIRPIAKEESSAWVCLWTRLNHPALFRCLGLWTSSDLFVGLPYLVFLQSLGAPSSCPVVSLQVVSIDLGRLTEAFLLVGHALKPCLSRTKISRHLILNVFQG